MYVEYGVKVIKFGKVKIMLVIKFYRLYKEIEKKKKLEVLIT